MCKLVYDVPVEPGTVWEENLYHDVVRVVGGVVETNNPLTIEALQYRGFTLVPDEPPVVEAEADSVSVAEAEPQVAPTTGRRGRGASAASATKE